jgi:alanine dehydrogenase
MALLIREAEVHELVSMAEAADAVEEAFRQLGTGKAFNNPRTRIKLSGEILHVLPAAIPQQDALGLKAYTAFRTGIRFLVLLYSAKTGELKSLMQAQRVGALRTGGVASVAIKHMARPDVRHGALFGAGVMGSAMLEGMVNARRFESIRVFDLDAARLRSFCSEWSEKLQTDISPAGSPDEAIAEADIVVTMTTAKDPVFDGKKLRDGATVVAAGSNLLQKREIDSTVIRRATRIVVESIEQSKLEAGDLFVPIDAGHLHWNQVRELSQIVLGQTPGRESDDEINVFKSVGLGLQDMAVAALAYEAAVRAGAGTEVDI